MMNKPKRIGNLSGCTVADGTRNIQVHPLTALLWRLADGSHSAEEIAIAMMETRNDINMCKKDFLDLVDKSIESMAKVGIVAV